MSPRHRPDPDSRKATPAEVARILKQTKESLPKQTSIVNADLAKRAKTIRAMIKPGSKITTGTELLKRLEAAQ